MTVGRRDSAQAGAWVINGAITQESFGIFGWVQESRCKICHGTGIEKHHLYECKGDRTSEDSWMTKTGCTSRLPDMVRSGLGKRNGGLSWSSYG